MVYEICYVMLGDMDCDNFQWLIVIVRPKLIFHIQQAKDKTQTSKGKLNV